MVKRKKTVYYVIDTKPVIQLNGFWQPLLGTHTTRKRIYSSQNVLYEGTNAKEANRIYRIKNKGLGVYDEDHNVMIYKGYEGEERVVLHKV